MKVAALYSRVSTKKEEQENALEASIIRVRDAATARGFEGIQVYKDSLSGSHEKRPDYQRMLAAARTGRVHAIFVTRLDRLTRSVSEAIRLVTELRGLKIDLVCVDQPHLDTTTAMGEFIFILFAALAQLERRFVQERVTRGLDTARARGRKLGRPVKAVNLAMRARDLRNGGASLNAIHTTMKAEGHNVTRSWVVRRCAGIPVPVCAASGVSVRPDSGTVPRPTPCTPSHSETSQTETKEPPP